MQNLLQNMILKTDLCENIFFLRYFWFYDPYSRLNFLSSSTFFLRFHFPSVAHCSAFYLHLFTLTHLLQTNILVSFILFTSHKWCECDIQYLDSTFKVDRPWSSDLSRLCLSTYKADFSSRIRWISLWLVENWG